MVFVDAYAKDWWVIERVSRRLLRQQMNFLQLLKDCYYESDR